MAGKDEQHGLKFAMSLVGQAGLIFLAALVLILKILEVFGIIKIETW